MDSEGFNFTISGSALGKSTAGLRDAMRALAEFPSSALTARDAFSELRTAMLPSLSGSTEWFWGTRQSRRVRRQRVRLRGRGITR